MEVDRILRINLYTFTYRLWIYPKKDGFPAIQLPIPPYFLVDSPLSSSVTPPGFPL